jgi:DNA-binding CsgD family transcriptional regulator
MVLSVYDFFKPFSIKNAPSEKDYEKISHYIKTIEQASRLTYQSVYIVDYYRKAFLYVSNNPIFLCGNTPEIVMKMGYNFYLKYIPEEDIKVLREINEAFFEFYKKIKQEDRLLYNISYDFHIKQPNKHLLLINHKLSPLVLDGLGNIWLALCYVSASSNNKSGNAIIKKHKSETAYLYNIEQKQWQSHLEFKLTASEKEILLLSREGLTMLEISKRLYLSIITIKFHRKNIFKKFQVKNMAEAIGYSENHHLL